MAKSTPSRSIHRSSITGRFVKLTGAERTIKRPAKTGSVTYRQVNKAMKKIASRRTKDGSS